MSDYRALIVSDIFDDASCGKKYDYSQFKVEYELKKWKDTQDTPHPPLRNYDLIIIDMTFKEETSLLDAEKSRGAFLLNLYNMLNVEEPFKLNKLIIIVLCGSKAISYPLPGECDERFFSSYDFIKLRLKDKNRYNLIKDEESGGDGFYPVATDMTLSYLDRFKKTGFFLHLDYDPESEECAGITPLARIREGYEKALTAFYYREQEGLIVVLPGYALAQSEIARKLVIDISRNLLRKKHAVPYSLSEKISPNVREDFMQAIICFDNGLYKASLVMSRRALEGCLIDQKIDLEVCNKLRAKAGKKRLKSLEYAKIYDMIEALYAQGKITELTKEKMHNIRGFGVLGAHSYDLHDLSKEDVYNINDFMRQCLEDIYVRDERVVLEQTTQRQKTLGQKQKGAKS